MKKEDDDNDLMMRIKRARYTSPITFWRRLQSLQLIMSLPLSATHLVNKQVTNTWTLFLKIVDCQSTTNLSSRSLNLLFQLMSNVPLVIIIITSSCLHIFAISHDVGHKGQSELALPIDCIDPKPSTNFLKGVVVVVGCRIVGGAWPESKIRVSLTTTFRFPFQVLSFFSLKYSSSITCTFYVCVVWIIETFVSITLSKKSNFLSFDGFYSEQLIMNLVSCMGIIKTFTLCG